MQTAWLNSGILKAGSPFRQFANILDILHRYYLTVKEPFALCVPLISLASVIEVSVVSSYRYEREYRVIASHWERDQVSVI